MLSKGTLRDPEMNIKVFYGPPMKVEAQIKKWLKHLKLLDIYQIDTVGLPATVEGQPDHIAVLIWLRGR